MFFLAAYVRLELAAGTYRLKHMVKFGACYGSNKHCSKYDRVEIIGSGQDTTILDALDATSHFFVNPGGCIKLSDLTVTKGSVSSMYRGGALTMVASNYINVPVS